MQYCAGSFERLHQMKRAIIAAILAALLLTGCGTETSTATEYSGFTVTRQGRETCITDTATGAEYHFITQRVKRAQDAAERARMKTAADTDTLTIRNAYNVIIVKPTFSGDSKEVKDDAERNHRRAAPRMGGKRRGYPESAERGREGTLSGRDQRQGKRAGNLPEDQRQ